MSRPSYVESLARARESLPPDVYQQSAYIIVRPFWSLFGRVYRVYTTDGRLAFFVRHPHQENVWRAKVAPIIAFVLLSIILAATVYGLGDLLQVEPGSMFHWLFPTGYAVFAVVVSRVSTRRGIESAAAAYGRLLPFFVVAVPVVAVIATSRAASLPHVLTLLWPI